MKDDTFIDALIPDNEDLDFLKEFYPSSYKSSYITEFKPPSFKCNGNLPAVNATEAQVAEIVEMVSTLDPDAVEDFNFARGNIKGLLSRLYPMLESWAKNIEYDKNPSPRNMEVFTEATKNFVEMNRELVTLHNFKDTMERLEDRSQQNQPRTVNNTIVMAGSTNDLNALAATILEQKKIQE